MPRLLDSTTLIKTTVSFVLSVVFLFFTSLSAQAQLKSGDVLINTARLAYDGAPDPVTVQNNGVLFRPPPDIGRPPEPPTAINLQCRTPEGGPACNNGEIPENTELFILGDLEVIDVDSEEHELFSLDPRFDIVDGTLRLAEGNSFNFEEGETTFDIKIKAVDGEDEDLEFEQVVTIQVTDVNESPFDLQSSSSFVVAGSTERRIGELTASDVDADEIQTFSVLGDERFTVLDNNILSLAEGVVLEPDTTIPVTVIVTDKGGLTTRTLVEVTTNPPPPDPGGDAPTIEFMAPAATGSEVEVPEATCSPPSGFLPDVGLQTSLRTNFLPGEVSGTQDLDTVGAYAIGDPVIVSVEDQQANLQPFELDRIEVRLEIDATGDSELLTLVETEVNSGIFVGFVFTTSQQSVTNDCILTVASRTEVDAIYTNRDGLQTVTTLAQISPVGILFNDATGEPISGVILALINDVTGEPADVRGDGPEFALFPSTIRTGETITDAAGNRYENGPGEYRFPAVPEGRYRIVIFNDEGWNFSTRPDGEIQSLGTQGSLESTSDGRFALNVASRGEPFEISQGSVPRTDIPVSQTVPPVELEPTPSTIEFFQYSANPNFGSPVDVGPTTCVAGVESQASQLQGDNIPVPGIVNLAPATVFKVGEPIFVQVTDLDQNFDPDVREQITIELQVPASNDREFIRLTETGPDTGRFAGYLQSTGDTNTATSNCELSVVQDEMIWTGYSDIFDETDISEALILVDPFGRIFSTRDGRLIDGITVTLIDTSTGAPADVFGDGPAFAPYPSTIISGGETVDEAGLVYDFPAGEYRFPFVRPGFYQLRFENIPGGLIFPSTASDEQIQTLFGAPFEIVAGSRGEEFEVPVGPAINIDVPLDEADGDMFVNKQVNKEIAAIGDFLQYTLLIQNNGGSLVANTQVQDTLPPGFRYQTGSLRIEGQKVPDPVIGTDGRTMLIDLPAVGASDVRVSYVVEITPAAGVGEAVNTAIVIGDLVTATNTGSASVFVGNDLFSQKAFLVGRVTFEQCVDEPVELEEETDENSGLIAEVPGLADVRIYLEDGSYVVTDEKGFWHMEGIEPGSHVVQLDIDSLEERYEISPCNENSRFAGSPYSQFVDVKGGTLWRADFKVQEKPAPQSDVELAQTLKVDDEGIWVEVATTNEGPVNISDSKVIYNVPKGWKIVPDSARLDGRVVKASSSIVGDIFDLGSVAEESKLRFLIEPKMKMAQQSPKPDNEMLVLRPRFETRSADLRQEDVATLIEQFKVLGQRNWKKIVVMGHSDDVPIAPRNRKYFASNKELSQARAGSVADLLAQYVQVDDLVVVGSGETYPIANNATRNGRRRNRRVELLMIPEAPPPAPQIVSADVLNGESAARLRFNSVGTAKGSIGPSRLPLNRLVGGFDTINSSVNGVALGSWDVLDAPIEAKETRDANVQGLIQPVAGDRLVNKTNSVKFDMDSRLRPVLKVDGVEISSERIGFKSNDDKTGKTFYSYIGVDFGEPGTHTIELAGVDGFGIARFEEKAEIVRVGDLFKINIVSTDGNVADGRTPVRAVLDLRDRFGEQIVSSYKLSYKSADLRPNRRDMSLSDLSLIQDGNLIDVAIDGSIAFEPVTRGGSYEVTLSYKDEFQDVEIFVEPEKRNWIMVGLAEGSVAYNEISGNIQNARDSGLEDDVETDGKVSFYAKGQVKGEYVLTIAYDSDKERKDSLEQVIDPNAFYTLYGDRTGTQYDAASQEKLFLKLEKEQFYALFGDYTTGLTEGELTNYSRSFSGLKSEYKSDKFEVILFASETDQAFIKDEIRGDGTSGLYRLSTRGIVINSEKITIQSRDRFKSEDIVSELSLSRHVDYNIDYDAGTLFFKQPIFSQDEAFNPTFIVVDYEVDARGTDELNFGGRVAYKPNDKTEVGLTYVKEGTERREGELAGVDARYEVNDNTEIRAEIAGTRSEIDGVKSDGTAFLVEATTRTEKLDATAYIRQQKGGFGLGQQNSSEISRRTYGVEGKYRVAEGIEVAADVYREVDLANDVSQDVATSSIEKQGDNYSLNAGLRTAISDGNGEDQVSNQLLLGGNYRILDGRMVLSANADTPIGGKGEAGDFPKRLRVGLDYKLTDSISFKAEQEFTWGDELNTQGTRIGMNSDLWEGGELVTTVEQTDEENSQRLAAVAGLRQRWNLNDNWSFDFGVDRSQTIKQETRQPPPLTVTTVFNSPSNDDFTALTFGSKFQKDSWDWTTRVEYRQADSEDKINLLSDVIHNLDEGKQLLAKLDVQSTESDSAESTTADIQLGYSYRPEDSRWTLFNRLDLRHSDSNTLGLDQTTQKIINNLNANYIWSDDTQIAFQYGFKYVTDNYDSDEYSGFTDLYGMEVRHDLNNRWDLGLQGSFYNSHNSDISDYSYGVSVGYSMARNVWVSLGYNFSGFNDDDFSAAEYTSEGIFLKYRFKFDQNTASNLMEMMRN